MAQASSWVRAGNSTLSWSIMKMNPSSACGKSKTVRVRASSVMLACVFGVGLVPQDIAQLVGQHFEKLVLHWLGVVPIGVDAAKHGDAVAADRTQNGVVSMVLFDHRGSIGVV